LLVGGGFARTTFGGWIGAFREDWIAVQDVNILEDGRWSEVLIAIN
jgi:hypothetical protein